jgi:hypothetical protein
MINALNIAQTMANVPIICQVSSSWLMERPFGYGGRRWGRPLAAIAQTMANVPIICQVSSSWLMERPFGYGGRRWGRPLAAIGAAPVNCFPIALPQSDSGLQSNLKDKAYKSNGCCDMHHKIGSRREFFDPIHRRVLAVQGHKLNCK